MAVAVRSLQLQHMVEPNLHHCWERCSVKLWSQCETVMLFSSHNLHCEVIWDLIGGVILESPVKYVHAFMHTQAHAHKAFHREPHRAHSVSSWMIPGPAVKAKAWNSMAVKCVSLWLLSSEEQQRGVFAEALHSVGPHCRQIVSYSLRTDLNYCNAMSLITSILKQYIITK